MKHLLKIEKFINQVLNEEALPLDIAKQFTKYGERRSQELNDRLDEIFGDKQRIYLPITKKRVSTVEPFVKGFLSSIGYEIEDYISGMAFQKENPKRKTRIGKLISQNKETELLQKFNMDPVRELANNQSEYSVVVSRHPYDIVGMSSGTGRENWFSSCMNLKHGNCRYIPHDIQMGTLTAYRIKTADRNIEKPFGRVNIKPFYYDEDEDTPFWFPDKKDYGIFGEDAREVLFDWIETFQPADDLEHGVYIKDTSLYSDEGSPGRYTFSGSYDDLTYGISKDEVMDINGDYLYTFREFFGEMGIDSDDVEVLDVDYYGDDPEELQIDDLRVNINSSVKFNTNDISEMEWYGRVVIPNLRVDEIDGDFTFLHDGNVPDSDTNDLINPFKYSKISGAMTWADISGDPPTHTMYWQMTTNKEDFYIDALDEGTSYVFNSMLEAYNRQDYTFNKVTIYRVYSADWDTYRFLDRLSGTVDNNTKMTFYEDMDDYMDMDSLSEDEEEIVSLTNSVRYLHSHNMFGGHFGDITNREKLIAHGSVEITNEGFVYENKLYLNIERVNGNFTLYGETLDSFDNFPTYVTGTVELINCGINDDVFVGFETNCKVLNLTHNDITTIPELTMVLDNVEKIILIDNPITEEEVLDSDILDYFPNLKMVVIGDEGSPKELSMVRKDGLDESIVAFLNSTITPRENNKKKFSLNPDGSVDVLGDMFISEDLKKIPIKINKVDDFIITRTQIDSVENFPNEVTGKFNLDRVSGFDNFIGMSPMTIRGMVLITNSEFSSFEGFNINIKPGNGWWCTIENKNYTIITIKGLDNVTSLEGFNILNPDCYANFEIKGMLKLKSLKGFPNIECRTLQISQNESLTSLLGAPNEIKVGYGITDNRLKSLEHLPTKSPSGYVVDNELTTLKGIPKLTELGELTLRSSNMNERELDIYLSKEDLEKVEFKNN